MSLLQKSDAAVTSAPRFVTSLAVLVTALAAGSPVEAQSLDRPIAGSVAAAAAAVPPAQSPAARELSSIYDRIWADFTQVYRNDKSPVIQQVLFTGRFQYDWSTLASDQGDHNEANIRRVRLGPRVTFLRKYLFHAEVEVNPQERNPFYVRMTDLYVQWTRNPQFAVTVGKQAVPFTQEGATSSKELLTIDRSISANNIWFPQEYMPGVSVSGRVAPWVYRGGVYSSGAMNRELGDFTGDYFTLAVLGYDFAGKLSVKEAVLTGNYLYQHPNVNNTFTRQLEQVVSTHFRLEADKWGVRADLSGGQGYLGQPDLWGTMLMPFYNITGKLQAVTRYSYLKSDGPNGIRLAGYEARVVPGRGDEYNELYLGANYYFYGQKLKVQTGVLWADMSDSANDGGEYSGVSWTTGLRVGW
jgi:phosphate-selective porin OprO/OprP